MVGHLLSTVKMMTTMIIVVMKMVMIIIDYGYGNYDDDGGDQR